MNPILEEIQPETAERLAAQAKARGLSVDEYLRSLLVASSGHPKNKEAETPPRNEAMLAVLRRSAERRKDMPVSGSTEETLKLIRRARGGEMWGYEPTDTEEHRQG